MNKETQLMLQLNTSGAWQTIVQFEVNRRDEVLRAAHVFAGILGKGAKWSIVHADGDREWLPDLMGPWEPIGAMSPRPLIDVMVCSIDSDGERQVFMAYRRDNLGEPATWTLSGTDEVRVPGRVYAWTPVIETAPEPDAMPVVRA
ncbi:hypothetical protein L2Y94_06510 [Luteibacter aegosomatis]|uniref:hypothetical protein n=1 Tax=Luteibacter aegosomatis TaxID=2911537 RepID=UPI001FF831C6|nr:hypothetical protein [Luteibacter aegosomatis]UPG87003.1 hypothetical protein L2Y94_06510 [Luteibacter aegosomatis]